MRCPAFRSAVIVFVGPVIVWRGRRVQLVIRVTDLKVRGRICWRARISAGLKTGGSIRGGSICLSALRLRERLSWPPPASAATTSTFSAGARVARLGSSG